MKTRKLIKIATIALIIVAGVIGVFFVYSLIGLPYTYDELKDEALSDLRSGKITVLEYCDRPGHNEELCTQYKNLHGIK
jgi:hypothetical protein